VASLRCLPPSHSSITPSGQVYGASENLVERASSVFNIRPDRVLHALQVFASPPSSHEELVAAYAAR
jgi:hypothetical protein